VAPRSSVVAVPRPRAILGDPWVRLGVGGTAGLLAVMLAAIAAGPSAEPLYRACLSGLGLFALAAALARGVRTRTDRNAHLLLAAGFVLTGLGAGLGMPSGRVAAPPEAFLGDAVWLARYPLLYGALALLLRTRGPRFGLGQAIDGLLGAFAAAAVFVLVTPHLAPAGASSWTTALRSTYPLLDVLVVGFLLGAALLNGWRLVHWLPLMLGILAFGISETIDVHAMLAHPSRAPNGATVPGYLLSGWLLATAVFVLQLHRSPPQPLRRSIALPTAFAATSVGVLLYSALATDSTQAVWFAAASLVVVLIRQATTLVENQRLLRRSQVEAMTDALTSLGNRRALIADLTEVVRTATVDAPIALTLFDLDGFKDYNDTFGHPAGDALLERLAAALSEAVAGAYRMGGDEFCVVTGADQHDAIARAHAALTSHGEGFVINASAGSVRIPAEADDPTEALRLADQRMYADKGARRTAVAQRSATHVLLQIVRERDPALRAHTQEVGGWAAEVARRLGADVDAVEEARLGGELHDVGKTAIPDAILGKPGPLTDVEWEFMQTHTVVGERILLADTALGAIAPIARSHHERWDGTGYPDRLQGEAIPPAARIVAVCDAYEAMVADRPYRAGRPPAEALAELERCAGSHFEPAVVEAFVAMMLDGGCVGSSSALSAAGLEPATTHL
jgi:two-component system cell cycle response regulator